MNPKFQITPLENNFNHLFDFTENELSAIGAVLLTADSNPGFPCRVSLQDAEIGEEVVLLPYQYHQTTSPYQAKGPIYIRKDAVPAKLEINAIPKMLLHRLLSLRVYNDEGMMILAETIEGKNLKGQIKNILLDQSVSYIHVHNAGPGCFNCQVNRVDD